MLKSNLDALQENSRRQHISSMALCSATNPDLSLDQRLSAAKTALAQWDIGSFAYWNVVDQIPELVALLSEKASA